MKTYYLVTKTYNPFHPKPITTEKGITRKFTKKEADEYVSNNYSHLTPLGIIEIWEGKNNEVFK